MTQDTPASLQSSMQFPITLFDALPGSCILLQNNAPHYTVLAATPDYLAQTGYRKEAIVGRGVFEMSPANPDDATDTGVRDLKASLEHVALHKEPHHLPVQRYDIAGAEVAPSLRYWSASNKPVLAENGEVAYIIHTAEDITHRMQAGNLKVQIKGMEQVYNVFMQAPTPISILIGRQLVVELANEPALQLWGRTTEIIGQPFEDAIPELRGQGIMELIRTVQETGIPRQVYESPLTLLRRGKEEVVYIDYVFEPYYDQDRSEIIGVLVLGYEVTERIQAKKVIKENEDRFRVLADATPNLFWILNADGSYRYVNKTTLRFLGVSADRLADGGWAPFLHPDEVDAVTLAVQEAVDQGKRYEKEHRLQHHDGTYRWVLSQALPVHGPGGAVEVYVGSGVDIHDRKIAEAGLEESEAKFRTMAEGTTVLIAVGNERGEASYFNRAWTGLTGRSMQSLIDQGWADLVHPQDREDYEQVYRNAFAGRGSSTGEFRVLNKEGQYRWLLAHGGVRADGGGSFMGYVSTCTDITENKLGQEQLERALEQVRLSKEAAELGTFDLDLEKESLHWDERCRTLFGISHPRPVTYEKDFVEGLHPEDRERILLAIEHSFNRSVSNGDYDVEYRTVGSEDGVIRWVRAKGKVYFNNTDVPVRFIGSALDITEQVNAIHKIERLVDERTAELAQANERLLRINTELQRSNQNLEEFAHAASHDLKEPVRKIHFFTNQLKDQLKAHLLEDQARAFGRIENATIRMGNLIDDLLLYSHVSQRPLQMESVDLLRKVEGVLEDLELDIQEKRAVVTTANLPVIRGYRRQLQQLFQNLISNAIKYSKPGEPPQVHVAGSEVTEEGRHYHLISVSDNGIGFEQQYAEKIFQMFSRLHGKNEYSGTGVGLSIVKKVVENHNGLIKVASSLHQGSTFDVYLPVDNNP